MFLRGEAVGEETCHLPVSSLVVQVQMLLLDDMKLSCTGTKNIIVLLLSGSDEPPCPSEILNP